MKRIIFIFVFLLPCSLWGQSDVVKSDNVIERLYRSSVNEEVFIGTDFDYHSYNNVLLHEKHKRLDLLYISIPIMKTIPSCSLIILVCILETANKQVMTAT